MNAAHIRQFVIERDEALKSTDEEKIRAYAKKYRINMPSQEIVFWLGVHKARLHIATLTEEEKQVSRDWIRFHGFKAEIEY